MNTRLKTVVTFALVVVLSAGLAMAGRGGGGGHGGGGGGHVVAAEVAADSTVEAAVADTTRLRSALRIRVSALRTRVSMRCVPPKPSRPGPDARESRPSSQNLAANRPDAGQRPGVANTPAWDNRLSAGNRANIDNRANLGDRSYVANRPNNRQQHQSTDEQFCRTNAIQLESQQFNGRNWYHGDWNGNWNNGWNNYQPLGWWVGGYWAGAALSAVPWSWGYYPYYNPYYGGSYVAGSAFDYSQPIVVTQASVAPAGVPGGLTAEQQATPLFDAARNAFMQGDYKTALAQVDQAIAQVPNDTVLHEFRGVALFALGRYKEAAAADYAVLSTGPGWDWTTLSALYPNVDVYTAQLRALEQYAKSHPAASDAKFLLAENYLTCGYTDAAAVQFKEVVQLDPKDQLSAQLLKSISASGTAQPAVSSQPAAPATPADASSFVGNWTATRADSARITLALAGDGKFTWSLDQKGKAATVQRHVYRCRQPPGAQAG